MPVISKDMPLGDAILEVSKGKMGLGVAIENDKVLGLITDGDLRRAMETWRQNFCGRTIKWFTGMRDI